VRPGRARRASEAQRVITGARPVPVVHTVEVSRFVRATPAELARALTPERLVSAEGTFEVVAVEETDGGALVSARASGVGVELRFEAREDGLWYEQAGGAGPFEAMETTVTYARENEGSRVTARSSVSLGLPLPLVDRVAAWKRRGELARALDRIADEVG